MKPFLKAPAQKKPPPKTAKPEHLSVFEVKKLGKAGRLDGHHSLPKQGGEDGVWTSPLLRKEADAYDEYCTFVWGALQEKHEETHRHGFQNARGVRGVLAGRL